MLPSPTATRQLLTARPSGQPHTSHRRSIDHNPACSQPAAWSALARRKRKSLQEACIEHTPLESLSCSYAAVVLVDDVAAQLRPKTDDNCFRGTGGSLNSNRIGKGGFLLFGIEHANHMTPVLANVTLHALDVFSTFLDFFLQPASRAQTEAAL